jgi:sialate O-acetylesterase
MRSVKLPLLAALVAAVGGATARADVKPHPLISDGMVLQQGGTAPIWGTADPGEKISTSFEPLPPGYKNIGVIADQDGKWRLDVQTAQFKAGTAYTLTIEGKNKIVIKDVAIGEVWVCSGQSNMEWSVNASAGAAEARANAKNPKLRLFTVKKTATKEPQTTVPTDGNNGKWLEAGPDTIGGFSAVAYFFGRDLQKDLDVPVGLIHTSWGGTASEEWTSMKVLEANPQHKGKHPREGQLYNGMIAPLIPYAFKGAIWYQGESNAGRAELYREGFPLMIKNWRDDWGQGDFPFLFVQLAPYMKIDENPSDTGWARLRDAQLHTLRTVKNTGMAVITDVGDEKDIHPKQKEPVGHRLELAALAVAYNKPVEFSGPLFDKMMVEGNQAVLSFTHVGKGLEVRPNPHLPEPQRMELSGFTVAGEDGKFYPARAEIKGDKVALSSDKVTKPVAVRYGWANYPMGNLWNKDGLPASPFRTDDWAPGAGPKPK